MYLHNITSAMDGLSRSGLHVQHSSINQYIDYFIYYIYIYIYTYTYYDTNQSQISEDHLLDQRCAGQQEFPGRQPEGYHQ